MTNPLYDFYVAPLPEEEKQVTSDPKHARCGRAYNTYALLCNRETLAHAQIFLTVKIKGSCCHNQILLQTPHMIYYKQQQKTHTHTETDRHGGKKSEKSRLKQSLLSWESLSRSRLEPRRATAIGGVDRQLARQDGRPSIGGRGRGVDRWGVVDGG